MHLKARVLNWKNPETGEPERLVMSGSMNPGDGASRNDENLNVIRDARIAELYEKKIDDVLAHHRTDNVWNNDQAINVLFTPAKSGPRPIEKLFEWIDAEQEQILINVFDMKDIIDPASKKKLTEKEVKPIRMAKDRYGPAIRKTIARPWPVIGAGAGLFAVAAIMFGFLGSEFTPQLDERDIAVQSLRIPSTSLERSLAMQRRVEDRLEEFPQVELVFSRTGTAEVASDPMPPNASDAYVILKPRDEWPDPDLPKDELVGEMESALGGLVGNLYEFSQPIELRFNELIAGVRGDVAVKLYGDDLTALTEAAGDVAGVLRGVEGAADVKVQQVTGFPTLDIAFDRPTIARYGLTVEDVAQSVAIALGGRPAGLVFEGDRRFDVVVRLADATRDDFDQLGALPIVLENGVTVPLRTLADFEVVDGLAEVRREQGRRLVIVSANVRERDLGSFVEEAQEGVSAQVDLPPASFIEWGGQYQNLQEAQARLTIVVPIAFALVLLLLFMALGGWVPALAVFSAIPMALAGGVFALALRGLPFSVSAAVGFIALSGVAVLNGLVMMTAIRQRLDSGMPLDEAVAARRFLLRGPPPRKDFSKVTHIL